MRTKNGFRERELYQKRKNEIDKWVQRERERERESFIKKEMKSYFGATIERDGTKLC